MTTSVSTPSEAADCVSCAWVMAKPVRAISPWLRSKIGSWMFMKSEAEVQPGDVGVVECDGRIYLAVGLRQIGTGSATRSRRVARRDSPACCAAP